MKILFASAEALPHYKTGGLADVARALPDALAAHGRDVRIIMPAYAFLRDAASRATSDGVITVPWLGGGVDVLAARLQGSPDEVPTVFLQGYHDFETDRPYDAVPGDPFSLPRRFAFFCRAVTAYANHWGADVVHLNDWQTGLVPVYALVDGLRAATVYAIHNLAYQGNFAPQTVTLLGLPPSLFRTENGFEFHGQVSFAKAGIALADRLVTVSPTYAQEIQTPAYGTGLDGLLSFRRRVLHGVLNGIDTTMWNPATDPLLPRRYNARTLLQKNENRAVLCERASIDGSGPILGVVTRLAYQKGIDVLLGALVELIDMGGRIVVLGSGEPAYEHVIASFATSFPDRVAFRPGFDEPLAHLIYAGADYFLMPSLYEPCGLGQMIAQRYGTPPIARRTGGLNDTIDDGMTGFLFDEPTPAAFAGAVRRAISSWRRRGWRALQSRCMREDHSWTRSATAYERIYDIAIAAV